MTKENLDKITKEEFMMVYNKHLPSEYMKFVYKYFSNSTIKEDMKLKNSIRFSLLIVFWLGFFGTVLGWEKYFVPIFVWIYVTGLIGIVLFISIAVLLNNLRLRKIAKKLDVSKYEFNYLSSKFII